MKPGERKNTVILETQQEMDDAEDWVYDRGEFLGVDTYELRIALDDEAPKEFIGGDEDFILQAVQRAAARLDFADDSANRAGDMYDEYLKKAHEQKLSILE